MKVLIADDEYDLLSTLVAIFEEEGHEVIPAESGQVALKVLETVRPDLVLLDVMMPRKSGVDVLREIRARPGLEEVPVIQMSAAVPRPDGAESRWSAFLRKPFTYDRLMEVVRRLTQADGR